MRSVSYILGGKPSNTSDCLDYCLRHKPQRIILALRAPEDVTDEYMVRWLKGAFVWFFDDITITYEAVFGGCFMHEPPERQRLSVDNANRRLTQELETIGSQLPGMRIEEEQQRFGYDVTRPRPE